MFWYISTQVLSLWRSLFDIVYRSTKAHDPPTVRWRMEKGVGAASIRKIQ